MKKKYLSEIIKERKLMDKFESNTLIVSPTGSGKTSFIFGEAIKEGQCLYLCDNNNLKSAIELKERTFSNRKDLYGFDNYQVEVMCYKSFGKKVRFNNEIIKEYDTIFCDEVHNLIDYQSINDDTDLSHAIKELFKKYDNTKIYYFTATPYYLKLLKKQCKDLDKFVKTLDLTRDIEVKRFTELVKDTFTSYQQIPSIMNRFDNSFRYSGKKALIYTNSIESMNNIKDLLIKNNDIFKPICIWSINNDKNPLLDEQKLAREYLLKTGTLLDPYNVLIINRATETGVDIIDKDMMYCIINTTNKTEQIQARGRLRHDIIELRLRSNKSNTTMIESYEIEFYLNRVLTKADKDAMCESLKRYDNRGRLIKWTSLSKVLISQGYMIKDSNIRIDGKITRVSTITK
ncbi:DEAD/DEAH box helicase family protein [uncultured Clostridium sp.]|uniref:DEAD/DEAH box helicase family protein n=1 Tax=uncultured Clostridium sp. TaxID=59620 RepID=UPI0025EA0F6E|nr:DEAD/DEAH box helicase family protein [uncultured Clostridium sp.]